MQNLFKINQLEYIKNYQKKQQQERQIKKV